MFLPATTAFIAFVLTNWNMLFAMVILILYLLRVFMIHPIIEPHYVHARVGMNYQLYVRNYSRNTNYEIVATVDGLDVLNGKQGSLNNNGYIVNAGDSLAIKGFRKDKHTEAAFQFARRC